MCTARVHVFVCMCICVVHTYKRSRRSHCVCMYTTHMYECSRFFFFCSSVCMVCMRGMHMTVRYGNNNFFQYGGVWMSCTNFDTNSKFEPNAWKLKSRKWLKMPYICTENGMISQENDARFALKWFLRFFRENSRWFSLIAYSYASENRSSCVYSSFQ